MDVKLANHHLHVRSLGEGAPTYLLLHGWAVSSSVWDPLVERWPAHAGRLLIPDLRGTGFSGKPLDGYSLDDHANDVVAIIDHVVGQAPAEGGGAPLILVGHSMGGTIAMRAALARPAALRKLVLVSPVPPSGVPLSDGDIAYFRSLHGTRQGAEQTLGMMLVKRPDDALFDRLVRDMATVAPQAFLGGFDAWRTASFAVDGIRTPTVVIGGEQEQPLSPALLRSQVVERIPGASFVGVPGVGHYPQVESPAEFAALLQQLGAL